MSDDRISFRWGIPELDHGNVLIPEPIYRFHGRVGVKGNRFVLIVQLAAFKYESKSGAAKPGLATLARRMGITKRNIIRIIQKLEEEGWLKVKRTISEHGGLEKNEYNFEPFSRACWKLYAGGSDIMSPGVVTSASPGVVTSASPPRKEEESKKKNSKNTSAPKPRFPAEDYRQVEKAYSEIKGIEPNGDEWGPIQRDIKLMFKSGNTPQTIINFMRALEDSPLAWTDTWTIKTVRMKLPEWRADKLNLSANGDDRIRALRDDISEIDRYVESQLDPRLIELERRDVDVGDLTVEQCEEVARLHQLRQAKIAERERLVRELGK